MKNGKSLHLFLALFFTLNISFFAQVDNAAQSPKLNYETVPNDPLKARIYTLSNGMKVYMSVYKDAPRIQTLIAVKAGSKNDPHDATGLAHYLEHMVFKGTDKFGTKDFEKENEQLKKIEELYEVYRGTKDPQQRKVIYHRIDSISGLAAKYAIANEYDKMLAGIGAKGTNAFTSYDQTVYVNDIPSNQVETWLEIEAERFRKPVLRLFHTELEAVYEEKNRGLDDDQEKVWDGIMSGLFQKHTYGTQTTIGTIEHLKNPSMKEIMKYYNKYYVPNNMAIVMSGDFDPDKTIQQIETYFGKFGSKPVEPFKFEKEAPITSRIVKEVKGPDAELVALGWRFEGDGSKDADMLTLVQALMYNGKAGLLDLNLNQAQKVLGSYAYDEVMKDYSMHLFMGVPKSGQTLESVEKLILGQINLLKEGKFPDWMLKAVITDLKLQKTKELESNGSRAMAMMDAFTADQNWEHVVNTIERLSKITKQQIVEFVKENYKDNNYVVVFKRKGEDNSVEKVEKPSITPVDVDRDNKSPFVKHVLSSTPVPLEPKFIDYEKDITKDEVKSGIPIIYNKNTENLTFELFYVFDMGSNNDKLLKTAIDYIPYLGTSVKTPAQIQEELYKLGCTLAVFTDIDETWVSLSGLSENFEKALQLFENLLSDPKVEKNSLDNLVSDILKQREDAKLNKGVILNTAMVSYALYGPVNPFTYILSEKELRALSTDDISKKLKSLNEYKHRILFYGPQNLSEIKTTLNTHHKVPSALKPVPAEHDFKREQLGNKVYVTDYDMTQAEIVMLSNGCSYTQSLTPVISLYNNYFGGTMSGVVFQDLRESKALAYSAYSRFMNPGKPDKPYFNYSYIGSQADKLSEALTGMTNLLSDVPNADASFVAAKEMLIQSIRSERITKSQVLFNYITAVKYNHDHDLRKDVFEKCQRMNFDDVKGFQQTYIKGQPVTTLVLGKISALDFKVLEKYGPVKKLSLKELFGY